MKKTIITIVSFFMIFLMISSTTAVSNIRYETEKNIINEGTEKDVKTFDFEDIEPR